MSGRTSAFPGLLRLPKRVCIVYLSLFTLAFVTYGNVWPQAPIAGGDTEGYMRAAAAISNGRIDQLQERTPGYPLLLVATGSTEKPGRLLFYVSLTLHLAAVWLLGIVLHSIGLRDYMVMACGAIMLLPPYVQTAAFALSENLTMFCLVAGFTALYFHIRLIRPGCLFAASIAFACAAITRPTFELLASFLAVSLVLVALATRLKAFRPGRMLRDGFVLLSVPTIVVVGYSFFNYAKFGYFGMTPLLGPTLTTRTARLYEHIPDLRVRQLLVEARDRAWLNHGAPTWVVFSLTAELMRVTGKSELEVMKLLARQSVRLIVSHPEVYLEDVARSLVEYWFPVASRLPLLGSSVAKVIWYGFHFVVMGLFVGGVVVQVGVFLVSKLGGVVLPGVQLASVAAWVIAVTVVMYDALISCAVAEGAFRYRAPTDLLMLAAVFAGLQTMRNLWLGRAARVADGPDVQDPAE